MWKKIVCILLAIVLIVLGGASVYAFRTCQKAQDYTLDFAPVEYTKYDFSYIIPVKGDNADAVQQAYQKAVTLSKTAAAGYDSICIQLENKRYHFDKPLVLQQAPASGLTIVFSAPEQAVFSGSVQVTGGWEPYQNGIFCTSVAAEPFRQLYVDGVLATRARFPEKNENYKKEVQTGKWQDEQQTLYLPQDFQALLQTASFDALELHIIEAWTHSVAKVQELRAADKGVEAVFTDACTEKFFSQRSSKIAEPFVWAENDLSLVNTPGEWYYDDAAQMLYYYPESQDALAELQFDIPQTSHLLEVRDTSHIRFENITFAYTNWNEPSASGFADVQGTRYMDLDEIGVVWRMPPAALRIQNSDSVEFLRCTVNGAGSTGVQYDGGCDDVLLYHNDFTQTAGTAVCVGSFADTDPAAQPISKHVVIADNIINGYGKSYLGGIGIMVGYGLDVQLTCNEVCHGSYTGISVGWGWGAESGMSGYSICGNRVTDVIENHLYDGAGLYVLGRFADGPVNEIKGNYLEGGHGYAGLYFDEMSNNFSAEHNYIGKGESWFLLMHDIRYGLQDISVQYNYVETGRKHINSYAGQDGVEEVSTDDRNVFVRWNMTPLYPCYSANKTALYENAGRRSK